MTNHKETAESLCFLGVIFFLFFVVRIKRTFCRSGILLFINIHFLVIIFVVVSMPQTRQQILGPHENVWFYNIQIDNPFTHAILNTCCKQIKLHFCINKWINMQNKYHLNSFHTMILKMLLVDHDIVFIIYSKETKIFSKAVKMSVKIGTLKKDVEFSILYKVSLIFLIDAIMFLLRNRKIQVKSYRTQWSWGQNVVFHCYYFSKSCVWREVFHHPFLLVLYARIGRDPQFLRYVCFFKVDHSKGGNPTDYKTQHNGQHRICAHKLPKAESAYDIVCLLTYEQINLFSNT